MMDNANMIIPTPPIQWVADLQKSRPFGSASMSDKMDDPVVVNPETLSNHEFVMVNSPPHNTYGTIPKRHANSQLDTRMTNPSLLAISFAGGTKINGKAPNSAEMRQVYARGRNAESLLKNEIAADRNRKAALSSKMIPTYLRMMCNLIRIVSFY